MPRLIILVEEAERFVRERYFAKLMVPAWEAGGWSVAVHALDPLATPEPGRWPAADAALVHLDLTVLPGALCDALRHRYPVAINAGTRDISKRRVSQQLVAPGDGWDGPVIVKTNANCGGISERRQRYAGGLGGRGRWVYDHLLPWSVTGRLRTRDYPVYDSPAAVPARAWSHPGLVVERFLAEREEGLYALRQWVFLGDREIHRRTLAPSPVVKSGDGVRTETLGEVPAELRARRGELGFDYGKFDYVLHEGRGVLLDANRTPTHGAHLGDTGRALAAGLAAGLDALR